MKLAESIGATQAAHDLGIARSLVSSWKKSLATEGKDAFRGKGHPTEEQSEMLRLRRENATLRMEREILKEAAEFARAIVQYGFIFEHQIFYPLRLLCRALDVTKGGYLRWRNHPHSARDEQDTDLIRRIAGIQAANRQTYGSPRVQATLQHQGVAVSRKRVPRLMREAGLNAEVPRIRVAPTDSDHDSPIADNVVERDFTATAPNQKWVTDITYIRTDEGWLYLSAILDLYSRKVIGWAMDQTMETSLVTRSLDMALANRRPATGLIHHSDRGSQYASSDYRQRLIQSGITISMSRRGNCHDNACAESFWGRLQVELVYRQRFVTRAQARQSIFDYIETFHNHTRIHSAIGYVTPQAYEEAYYASLHVA